MFISHCVELDAKVVATPAGSVTIGGVVVVSVVFVVSCVLLGCILAFEQENKIRSGKISARQD